MKMSIESTPTLGGVIGSQGLCRIWRGTTESGVQANVYVRRVVVCPDQDLTDSERELIEQPIDKECGATAPNEGTSRHDWPDAHQRHKERWTKRLSEKPEQWEEYSAAVAGNQNGPLVERIKATTEALNAITRAASRSANLDEDDVLEEHISRVSTVLTELVTRQETKPETTTAAGKGGTPLTAETFRQLGFTLHDNGGWRMPLPEECVGSSTWRNFLQLVDHGVEGEWYAEIHSTSQDDTTGEASESSVCLPRVFRTRGDVCVLLIACGVTR